MRGTSGTITGRSGSLKNLTDERKLSEHRHGAWVSSAPSPGRDPDQPARTYGLKVDYRSGSEPQGTVHASADTSATRPVSAIASVPLEGLSAVPGRRHEPGYAKTAFGLRDWARELCVGEFACPEATVSTRSAAPDSEGGLRPQARSLVIGIANTGGVIKPSSIYELVDRPSRRVSISSRRYGRLKDSRTSRRPQSVSLGAN